MHKILHVKSLHVKVLHVKVIHIPGGRCQGLIFVHPETLVPVPLKHPWSFVMLKPIALSHILLISKNTCIYFSNIYTWLLSYPHAISDNFYSTWFETQ